jgi:hypothetical protein
LKMVFQTKKNGHSSRNIIINDFYMESIYN